MLYEQKQLHFIVLFVMLLDEPLLRRVRHLRAPFSYVGFFLFLLSFELPWGIAVSLKKYMLQSIERMSLHILLVPEYENKERYL